MASVDWDSIQWGTVPNWFSGLGIAFGGASFFRERWNDDHAQARLVHIEDQASGLPSEARSTELFCRNGYEHGSLSDVTINVTVRLDAGTVTTEGMVASVGAGKRARLVLDPEIPPTVDRSIEAWTATFTDCRGRSWNKSSNGVVRRKRWNRRTNR